MPRDFETRVRPAARCPRRAASRDGRTHRSTRAPGATRGRRPARAHRRRRADAGGVIRRAGRRVDHERGVVADPRPPRGSERSCRAPRRRPRRRCRAPRGSCRRHRRATGLGVARVGGVRRRGRGGAAVRAGHAGATGNDGRADVGRVGARRAAPVAAGRRRRHPRLRGTRPRGRARSTPAGVGARAVPSATQRVPPLHRRSALARNHRAVRRAARRRRDP